MRERDTPTSSSTLTSFRKIAQLDSLKKEIADMQRLVEEMVAKWHCEIAVQCERGFFRQTSERNPVPYRAGQGS